MTSYLSIFQTNTMKIISKVLIFVFFGYSFTNVSAVNKGSFAKYKDAKQPTEVRVNDLLMKMTIEEKLGQLNMPALENNDEAMHSDLMKGKISAFCVVRPYPLSVKMRNELQTLAVEKSRLGIPVIFAFDVIHGYKTIFPTPLALSASWDTELAKNTAQIAACEASVSGIDLTFSPMVDVARDPRWGRISEGSGEDVLMNRRFGKAMVEGYQGADLTAKYSMGACVKHFVGYGAAMGGRDYQFTELSERALRETYLPPFQECVNAGAVSIMSAFNDISGLPAAANSFTLDQVLRKEWGFKGFVVSDWKAIDQLKAHGIAETDQQAANAALSAGNDMEMKTQCYNTLAKEVNGKRFSEKIIDEAVKRVLRIKFKLGLFENPYTIEGEESISQLSPENRVLARKAASESMVLLKNSDLLPIKENSGRITLLGEWANNKDVIGWWTGNGDKKDVVTVFDGLSQNLPKGVEISFSAEPQTLNSKTVIVCVGESGNMFGENHCRSEITLPWGQTEQIKQLKESGHKVIVVIFNGRPLVLTEIEKYADAILLAWHPGTEAGNALADVLFGITNPSGHVTTTFPKKSGQIPLFYSDRTSGRPGYNSYLDVDAEPLYPFGFGLSYTSFSYSNMVLSKKLISKNESFNVSINVSNTGNVTGKEVVQLYMHQKVATITQAKKKLIDFQKIELKPGETQTVTFMVSPDELAILDKNLKSVIESGDFDIWIGKNSHDEAQHEIVTVK